jgi:hypothetical protein
MTGFYVDGGKPLGSVTMTVINGCISSKCLGKVVWHGVNVLQFCVPDMP